MDLFLVLRRADGSGAAARAVPLVQGGRGVGVAGLPSAQVRQGNAQVSV